MHYLNTSVVYKQLMHKKFRKEMKMELLEKILTDHLLTKCTQLKISGIYSIIWQASNPF